MNIKQYTYRVTWSPEDEAKVVADVVADMQASGEPVPEPMAEKHLQRRVQGAHTAATSSQPGDDGGRARG